MKNIFYIYLVLILFIGLISCTSNDVPKNTSGVLNNKSGIKGKIFYLGKPMEKAVAFVNLKENRIEMGMPFSVSKPSDQNGNFILDLKPGKYYLSFKKKLDNSSFGGALLIGDYYVTYTKNPVTVEPYKYLDIDKIELKLVTGYGESFVNAPKNTGISGSLTIPEGTSLEDIYIYVYEDDFTDLKGPSFLISAPVDNKGKFKVDLPLGKYFVVARKRQDKKKTGSLSPGDFNIRYHRNPVEVILDKYTEIEPMVLKKIDENKFKKNIEEGFSKFKDTGIEGIILDKNNKPIAGLYAFVYKESQMVGKPLYISFKTKEDGKFTIYLKPGVYYLGARSKYSGPIDADDELIGSYDENPEHLIKIEKEKIIKNVRIIAKDWDVSNE